METSSALATPAREVLAVGLLALSLAPVQAQVYQLSDVAAGTGGFAMDGDAYSKSGRWSSAAGDVNGDGIGDLLVGANSATGPIGADGKAYVVFGRSVPGAPTQLSDIEGGTGGFAIVGSSPTDEFGYACATLGDINGDQLADIAVGDYGYDATNKGRVWVVFGKSTPGPAGGFSTAQIAAGTGGFALDGEANFDAAGYSLAGVGDMNGDGLPELAISSRRHAANGNFNAGRVYVVFGSSTWPPPVPIQLSDVAAGTGGFAIDGPSAGAQIGDVIGSAGDMNGDGLADLAISASLVDTAAAGNGAAYVIYGSTAAAPPGGIELSALGTAGFAVYNSDTTGALGSSAMGAGDTNGDGLADLVIGAEFQTANGASSAGNAYVVFGRTNPFPLGIIDTSHLANSVYGYRLNGETNFERTGDSVSGAGDVNGDGLADILVGATSHDGLLGRTFVVLGRTSLPPAGGFDLSNLATGTGGYVLKGNTATGLVGKPVNAVGDIDGDGLADVMTAGALSDLPVGYDAGRTYVHYSPYTPPASATYRAWQPGGVNSMFLAPRGIGISHNGDGVTTFPDSRLWTAFSNGSGLGPDGASMTTITLHRTAPVITGSFSGVDTASVYWDYTTNRTGWSIAGVGVRYTDAEIAGLNEAALRLYHAPSLSSPFQLSSPDFFVLMPERNILLASVPYSPAVLVLAEAPPEVVSPNPTITRVTVTDTTSSQNPTWLVLFSEPLQGPPTPDDIVPTGALAGVVGAITVTPGPGADYLVKLYVEGVDVTGSIGFNLVAGAVSDLYGNPSLAASAPAYTIAEASGSPVPGDIDNNGVTNVADVTALADHIVNGTPLP